MKSTILIVLLVIIRTCGAAQSTFEFLYASGLHEIAKSSAEDEVGNLFVPVKIFQYGLT